MKVELFACVKSPQFETEEEMLSYIASQSRNIIPVSTVGLFERTVDLNHKTIQEFAFYVFHIQDVSRVLLAQLTRHRIACYNVQSGRHNIPDKCVLPNGIKRIEGKIFLENGESYYWYSDNIDFLGGNVPDYPIEDLRYGFPEGTCVNLFMGINGSSLRNFFKLRMDKHAQWEIRKLANYVYGLIYQYDPIMLKGIEQWEKEI